MLKPQTSREEGGKFQGNPPNDNTGLPSSCIVISDSENDLCVLDEVGAGTFTSTNWSKEGKEEEEARAVKSGKSELETSRTSRGVPVRESRNHSEGCQPSEVIILSSEESVVGLRDGEGGEGGGDSVSEGSSCAEEEDEEGEEEGEEEESGEDSTSGSSDETRSSDMKLCSSPEEAISPAVGESNRFFSSVTNYDVIGVKSRR